MLSILIPTYNYNVYPLVKVIHSQALNCNISFEILVYDDGSNSKLNSDNKLINNLPNCVFKELHVNIGRSAIRNLLGKDAKFDWLLFLDADVIPVRNNFLQKYLNLLPKNPDVIYGGIEYQKREPEKDCLLRWFYGKNREALNVAQRNKNKYLRFLTLNFLIRKSVFENVKFNETIPNLRHEDTLFAYNLKNAKINILHINNPIYHLGLDTSEEFIKKSLESIHSLLFLSTNNLIPNKYIKISKVYAFCKKTYLNVFFANLYKKYNTLFIENLLSKKPSLFVLDLYRLSYLCFIDRNK
jgi:hypothetical protein